MNICFLDNNNISYDHNDLNSNKIRGAERALINLVLTLKLTSWLLALSCTLGILGILIILTP